MEQDQDRLYAEQWEKARKKRKAAAELVKQGMDRPPFIVTVKPYTLAEVFSVVMGRRYRGVGQAEQGPNDAWDINRGQNIALGRAVMMIAKKAHLLDRTSMSERPEMVDNPLNLGNQWYQMPRIEISEGGDNAESASVSIQNLEVASMKDVAVAEVKADPAPVEVAKPDGPAVTARVARIKIARMNQVADKPIDVIAQPAPRSNGNGNGNSAEAYRRVGKWIKDSYWYFTHERHCDRCGQTFSWRERRPNPKPTLVTLMGESRAWTEREHTCAPEVVLRETHPRITTIKVA